MTNKKTKKPIAQNPSNIFAKLFKFGVLSFVWSVIGFSILLFVLYLQLPSINEVANSTVRTPNIRILDTNGKFLGNYGDGYGRVVNVEKLPKHIPQAFIAIEDIRFYDHSGIDFKSIGRAFVTNIVKGRISQGGSTITQQVAKNLFLTNERTLIRKIKELIYTVQLENGFTKDQILSLYLNRVYMGNGQYGISAAAKHYFGTTPEKLTLWQVAVLAGMMKAPNGYNPIYKPKKSAKRARLVLKKMADYQFITDKVAKKNSQHTVKTISQKNSRMLFFTDYVVNQLKDKVDYINQDLIVHTTLDLTKQKGAYYSIDAYKKSFIKRGANQVAMVSMDTSGAIRVMVGGIDNKSFYNRAVQSKRPIGSLFKSYVYGVAMGRYKPETLVNDAPINIDGYQPKNSDNKFYGKVPLTYAFKKSLNISAIKVQEKIGRDTIIDFALNSGLEKPIPNVTSMALGTTEQSLLNVVASYGVFATGGIKVNPYIISTVTDTDKNIIYQHIAVGGQIVDRGIITKFNNLARRVIKDKDGTGRYGNIPNADIAGKTGTTGNYRDAWFVGYSPQVITGVWMGNDDNSPTKKIGGGSYPALIWKGYMKNIVSRIWDGNLP